MKVAITVNGAAYVHDVEPRSLLVHCLRDIVGLTGYHNIVKAVLAAAETAP